MLHLLNNRVRLNHNKKHWIGLYRCECGVEVEALNYKVKQGAKVSCGCRHVKHGGRNTKLYSVWRHMRARCEKRSNDDFINYGARGISVCPEWSDFKVFRAWAEQSGYKSELTIDRINNEGNYEPSNCRWATVTQQNRNRRSVKINIEIARVIRRLREAGLGMAEIGSVFGIARRSVGCIVSGKQWIA